MRQLKHKNIVELLNFIESPQHYFIVLELVRGGELFHQIVRLTYFSEDLSRHVIIQVAEAIRYLHEEAGVVHRDIKPENLLFYPTAFVPSASPHVRSGEDADKQDEGVYLPGVGAGGIGVIKLADFGLSKVIWDAKTMTPCGTVGYTAPEIVNDQRYSKSVDMWALGCVLYTILCGFPPFYDEDVQVLTEKVARGEYTFLSPWWDEISKEAKGLVAHLLTVDPDKRYTIDQFLTHPWIAQGLGAAPIARKNSASMSEGEAAAQAQVFDSSYFAGYSPEPATTEQHVSVADPKAGKPSKTYPLTPAVAYPKTPNTTANTHAVADDYPTAHIVPPDSLFVPEKAYMSPAVVAMREAFDVFNAVHRREEENVTAGRVRGLRNSGGVKSVIAKKLAKERAGTDVLGGLEEEEEIDAQECFESESDEEEVYEDKLKTEPDQVDETSTKLDNVSLSPSPKTTLQTNLETFNSLSPSSGPITSPKSATALASSDKFFELSLESSTLIERRKRASSSGAVKPFGGLEMLTGPKEKEKEQHFRKKASSVSMGMSPFGFTMTSINPKSEKE